MSDRIDELQTENRQLRTEYDILKRQYAELEMDLQAAEQKITELETEWESAGEGMTSLAGDEERLYLGSKRRNVFHRPTCEYAQYLVASPNLIEFGSHREAREAGYKPCKTCRA